MGKVIITIESDQLSNDNLESIVRWATWTESQFEIEAKERYQFRPDVRVYIVPSDEEEYIDKKTCLDCKNYEYCSPSIRHWYFDSPEYCPDNKRDLKQEYENFNKHYKGG